MTIQPSAGDRTGHRISATSDALAAPPRNLPGKRRGHIRAGDSSGHALPMSRSPGQDGLGSGLSGSWPTRAT